MTEYADQGNDLAKSTFGYLYEKSEIIKKDINKAFEYYKKYANYECNAEAQYLIAIYFSENAEHQKYLYWLRKSAENGCTEAWYYLAMDSDNNKESFKWCLKSATIENTNAQNLLGNFYYGGIGCKKDINKAFKWYKISAKQNNDLAQENLGDLYERGKGVKQNYKKAVYWYKKSAEQNNEYAQYSLGYMYEKGRGVKQNYKKAFKLYKQSAINDHPDGQYRLGYLYEKGKGTEKNLEKALEWYQKSAEQNYRKAQNAYERVSKKRV